MRKSLLILSTAGVLMLTSCGASYEEVETLVKENYVQSKAQEQYSSYKCTIVSNVKKADGIFAAGYEVGESTDEYTDDVLPDVFSVEDLEEYKEYANVEYTISGKELTITVSYSKEEINDYLKSMDLTGNGLSVSGSVKGLLQTNEYGLPAKSEFSMTLSISYTSSGVSASGNLDVVNTITYTYTK